MATKLTHAAAASARREPRTSGVRAPRSSRGHAWLLVAALGGLAGGVIAYALGVSSWAAWLWAATAAGALIVSVVSTVRSLLDRALGVDVVAALALGAALLLEEYLAGSIIAVMLASGSALERFAAARARRELSVLLERAPRIAHRRGADAIEDVPVGDVAVGDVLVVKPGEVIPADGILASAHAVLDESALTGEARPVQADMGAVLRSGGTNAGSPLEMRVASPPAASTYAAIVHLIRSAEQSKAPFVRLADRYALAFVVGTLVVAAIAWLAGGPTRALAVLVVATPCPLILAAPAAIISGVSRAARAGVIVKGGGPLEALSRVRVVLLDKTGTITSGRPRVVSVEAIGPVASDEIVRVAASLEQASAHPYAPALLTEARDRNLALTFPTEVHEQMGTGITGHVEGLAVSVGQLAFVAPGAPSSPDQRALALRIAVEGTSAVYVAIDGTLVGAVILHDSLRVEAPRVVRDLRRAGVRHIHMVTGDHPDVAELVGDAVGIDRVYAERTPEEKVQVVRLVRADGVTAMVGDGINDAPALALADVGIAIGARGATAASEAADVVLISDRLESLVHAIRIAQRTRRIALQSVLVGMGLTLIAMTFAAAGYITPIAGALLQEAIDVLVILNALRALTGGGEAKRRTASSSEIAQRLASAHRALSPQVGELAALASRLDTLAPPVARAQLVATCEALDNELLPHEREEERTAYPAVTRALPGEDPTGPLVQTHHEIHRLARLLSRLVQRLPPEGPRPEDMRDLRRVLYGLHAILALHFRQEEEVYRLLE